MRFMASCLIYIFFLISISFAQLWIPDLGNGKYKNPIIYADYSDPDVVRVGDDFYMVASSFNCMPGIPVLHSKDLVNWKIIGHVYEKLPFEKYNKPAHGQGSWAPSIRYHNKLYYVYFCTPHEGLFVATAEDPSGPWELEHIVDVELWEDPCPLWDDDGNAYLIRSKLRADILYLHKMSSDGKKILDNGTVIFNNVEKQPIIEGPKFLKKDSYYYIIAPAGGVVTGWQTVLRSKNISGPYEDKIILHQGNTNINGPHQGGLVELKSGEWWFFHFQDRDAYGRIVHLQPVVWKNGWPIVGEDINNDGIGEPVMEWKKPDVGNSYPITIPQTSDEFEHTKLDLQWQWHANPKIDWYSLSDNKGSLRLFSVRNYSQNANLWMVPNLMLQKFPAPSFIATTKISFNPDLIGERSGLLIMGKEWAFVALEKTNGGIQLGMYIGSYFQGFDKTEKIKSIGLNQNECYLRVYVNDQGECTFAFSIDGNSFQTIGNEFKAVPGMWIGAKVGLFNVNPNINVSSGYSDFDWFRFNQE